MSEFFYPKKQNKEKFQQIHLYIEDYEIILDKDLEEEEDEEDKKHNSYLLEIL